MILLLLEEIIATCLFVLGESALSPLTVGESAFSQLVGIVFLFRIVLFLLYYHALRVFLFASLSGHQLHQMVSLFLLYHTSWKKVVHHWRRTSREAPAIPYSYD